MTANAIQVCDVSMSFPVARPFRVVPAVRRAEARVTALEGLNLTVTAGQRVAVFGENGAGKTTLLRLVAGLLSPSAGRVLLGNHDASNRSATVRRKVGYVFGEERSFYWRLSGLENLRFFAALDNLFGSDADAELSHLLEAVGLGAHALRCVAEYSAGMRQRLALARGLLGSPEILLLDEPTRSLDPAGADAIHALLNGPLGQDRTLLLATNRFEDAASLCTRIAVLRQGRIVASQDISKEGALETLAVFVRSHLSANVAGA